MRSAPRHTKALTVVVEQLLDQVDVGEHHSSAAVSLEPELVQSVALVKVGLQQAQVRLPLVPDYLPAGEASHRDDHCCCTAVRTHYSSHTALQPSCGMSVLGTSCCAVAWPEEKRRSGEGETWMLSHPPPCLASSL